MGGHGKPLFVGIYRGNHDFRSFLGGAGSRPSTVAFGMGVGWGNLRNVWGIWGGTLEETCWTCWEFGWNSPIYAPQPGRSSNQTKHATVQDDFPGTVSVSRFHVCGLERVGTQDQ